MGSIEEEAEEEAGIEDELAVGDSSICVEA